MAVGNRENITFLLEDVTETIPRCSAAIMSDFLHHLPYEKHKICLEKTFDVLEAGGILLIVEFDPADKFSWKNRLGCFIEFLDLIPDRGCS